MAVQAARVVVGTTATLLSAAETDGRGGQSIAVKAVLGDVYIGPSTVTTATGFAVPAGSMIPLGLDPGESLYGIVGSGTVTCEVLRQGV